jgi:hypothetical protein
MISSLAKQGRQRAGEARIDAVSIWQEVFAHFEQFEKHLRRLRFFGQWDKLKADRSKEA